MSCLDYLAPELLTLPVIRTKVYLSYLDKKNLMKKMIQLVKNIHYFLIFNFVFCIAQQILVMDEFNISIF